MGFPFSSETSVPSASTRMNAFVDVVRMYMRDYPHLNRLTAGEETSSRMIAWAVVAALDDWNSSPPFIGTFSLTNFPSMSWLREATVMRVLEGVILLNTRNHLDFQDGGIQVSKGTSISMTQNFVGMLNARLENKKDRIKASINIEQAMDGSGVPSEYFLIAGHYLR